MKTAGIADVFPPGGKIKAVQEDGAKPLADPGAPVAVRDKNNKVEYLG